MAGQGTIGLELLQQVWGRAMDRRGARRAGVPGLRLRQAVCVSHQPLDQRLHTMPQVPDLDAIVVPVSGGGMLSGVLLVPVSAGCTMRSAARPGPPSCIGNLCSRLHPPAAFVLAPNCTSPGIAIAAKALRPAVKVVAAEPCGTNGAADAAASKAAGARAAGLPKTATICDGLQAQLGDLTWPVVRDLVDEVGRPCGWGWGAEWMKVGPLMPWAGGCDQAARCNRGQRNARCPAAPGRCARASQQVVVVGEEETVAAMRLIMERMKVAEGGLSLVWGDAKGWWCFGGAGHGMRLPAGLVGLG